jgi:(1->4)-alpha-D-glucan 1-alpha-D-glucosylmutase
LIIPRATYRLQFHRDFTFRDALGLVEYFAALGISHLYASPFLQARPGSTHGYDITHHDRLNPEVGTEEDLEGLVAALKARGMGLILDFVPNHMGIGSDNPWWVDVLEWGESSPVAPFFDIDWDAGHGKVLLPILGDQYGAIIAKGEIELRFDAATGSISAWYYEHRFPISPNDYAELLQGASVPDEEAEELARIVDDFARLAYESRRRWRAGIYAEIGQLKQDLASLSANAVARAAIEAAVASVNGKPGVRASWRALHALLERQAYRPAYWRVAADEINYRRFFNINDLAGLRVELPELFERMHALVFRYLDEGKLDGIRIDHIDGLFDPREYAERLQARFPQGLYVLVEKILAADEELPDWPVAGTTGYEFTNEVLGLLVDPDGQVPLERRYARLTGRSESCGEVLYASKRRIMQVNLASEMAVLAREFHRLSTSDWRSRDFTLNGMRQALEEVIAFFPVYRTYVSRRGATAEDRRRIEHAVGEAKRRSLAVDTSIFDFLGRLLTGDLARERYNRAEVLRLAMRLQQVTGPVTAKGVEDTAFYRYVPLLALNEVGGDPARFGVSPDEFHRFAKGRAERWPHALLATATHDTKRGEDARARLALLSELPREWGRNVARWHRLNGALLGEMAPNHEWLFYQTLYGSWPIGLAAKNAADLRERVAAYMTKAIREGKEFSGWANPNEAYEAAVTAFVEGALDYARSKAFLDEMAGFVAGTAPLGVINSLAQTLVKMTAPGVPDIYQGCELWDFSMVDPDNRRPVDYDARKRLLEDDGRTRPGGEKLLLVRKALALRAAHPRLFSEGSYEPVRVEGRWARHVVAFERRHGGSRLLVAIPRLIAGFGRGRDKPGWDDTRLLATGRWSDALAKRDLEAPLAASELFASFPVALLVAP